MLKTLLVCFCFFLLSFSNLASAQCNYTTCSTCVSSGSFCYWSPTHSACTSSSFAYTDSTRHCCGYDAGSTLIYQCSACTDCNNCTAATGCSWSPTWKCSSYTYSDSQTYCSSCVSTISGCVNCANCTSCVVQSNCYWSPTYGCTYGAIYGDSQGYCGTNLSGAAAAGLAAWIIAVIVIGIFCCCVLPIIIGILICAGVVGTAACCAQEAMNR